MHKWGNQPLSDLIARTRALMPPSAPGSLSDAQYQGLVALILRKNVADGKEFQWPASFDLSVGKAVLGDEWAEAELNSGETAPASKWESWEAAGSIAEAASSAAGFVNKAIENFEPVTDAMLADPPDQDWLSCRRTLDGQGYSPLDQVKRDNVKDLKLAWVLTMKAGSNQATPLVHDGVMYLAHPGNVVQAISADSGDLIWEYAYPFPPESQTLGGPTRNLAIHGDRLFMATYDAAIIALDARSGQLLSKQFAGADTSSQWFDFNEIAAASAEERLSILTRWIINSDRTREDYGLRIPGNEFPPAHGDLQSRQCLEALALFDEKTS